MEHNPRLLRDANEINMVIDGLAKQLIERTKPTDGQADKVDVDRADRLAELVKEQAK